MVSTCLVGCTGLVGSHILPALSKHASISRVDAISRRTLPGNPKLHTIQESDSTAWPSMYPKDTDIFISALGTTARIAGGFANQRKIDHDLNLSLAKAAKESGTTVYVLISTSGASSTSMVPYSKMKGELEEAIEALNFDHTVILKPGLLVGRREDSRPGEYAGRQMASFLGNISGGRLKDGWAQDADVVARAAVKAGLDAIDGSNTEKVRILGQKDIVRLGRSEQV